MESNEKNKFPALQTEKNASKPLYRHIGFFFVLCIFLALFASTPVFAAREVKNFDVAKKIAPADGIIVFLYGANWDKRGTAMLKTLWEKKIKPAAGNAAVIDLPVYQNPTEREKKKAAEKWCGWRTPKIFSYPCIVMLSDKAHKYAIIQGSDILDDPDKVVALFKAKLELYRKQAKLVSQAEKAKGLRKAELYGQASCILGIDPPFEALKRIKESDPKGETPYAKRLEFDVYKLMVDEQYFNDKEPEKKMMSVQEGLDRLKKLTSDDTYLPWQKQEMYGATTGFLRRQKYDNAKLKKLYEEMIAIDPDSEWANYAKESIRLWCTPKE